MMLRALDVYLQQELVGQLEQDRHGAMRFRYHDAWLAKKSAVPLSHSLPLRKDRFSRNECRPFFAGLLPEEDSRKLIAQTFGISDRNDFALLEKIGAECAGAVSLLHSNEILSAASAKYQELTLSELAGKFAELPRHPLLAGEKGIRLSLAGAQGKLVVRLQDGKFALPLNGSPSTHILKPDSPHYVGLAQNEYFCMRLAARSGLQVANVEMGIVGAFKFLQVERFDRKWLPNGQLERIHQEDFCQALGIPPELKYQQEGGPNLRKCFELVRAVSSVPGLDVLELFDAVLFNYLIGNGDAHGKNFSFLYEGERARVAPLYDLVCTEAYPDLSPALAMRIGGERKPARISKAHWRRFFEEAGFGQANAQRRLAEVARRVQREARALMNDNIPGADRVGSIVLANCQKLIGIDWNAG